MKAHNQNAARLVAVLYSGQLRLMSVNNSVSQSVDVFLIVDC